MDQDKNITLNKIVIFGTRHIVSSRAVYPGQRPASVRYSGGQKHQTYSTGRLEQALKLGLTPYVVSIRPAFGPHDAWWRKLIRPEQVFYAPGIMAAAAETGVADKRFETVMEAINKLWQRVYASLGVPWPQDARFADIDDPQNWLVKHCGVMDGATLTGFHPPN